MPNFSRIGMMQQAARVSARRKKERMKAERKQMEEIKIRQQEAEQRAKYEKAGHKEVNEDQEDYALRGSELEKLVGRILQLTNGRYNQSTYAQRLELVSADSDHQLLSRITNSTEMDWKQRPAYFAAICQTIVARVNGLQVAGEDSALEEDIEDEQLDDEYDDADLHCSFCNRSRSEYKGLIANDDDLCICDQCVVACYKVAVKSDWI